jgi:hypothetical protein
MAAEPKLLGGTFLDRARAQGAFDVLIGAGGRVDVDVAFCGSDGEHLLLVAAKDSDAEDWAVRVLREHGATVRARRFMDWLSDMPNELVQHAAGAGQAGSEQRTLWSRWAIIAILFLQDRLIAPPDRLASLLPSRTVPVARTADEQRRWREADEELQAVTERLEAELRARHPDLFDRRGRLRPAALARHLSEQTGGKDVLSGDELRLLEDGADAAAARSGRAP